MQKERDSLATYRHKYPKTGWHAVKINHLIRFKIDLMSPVRRSGVG